LVRQLRLTEEQLKKIQSRVVERGAAVRVNKIAEPDEEIPPPRSKYRNEITAEDGKVFHSKKEAERYRELSLLEHAKEIWDLKCQVKFVLAVGGVKVCSYIADFTYATKAGLVVEDCKGHKTDTYRIKRKLMKAVLGIDVLET
jgi:hypothetical protein